MNNGNRLTAQQRSFVAAYIQHKNATQAAIDAGYSRKTAQQQGSRLLSNAVVKQAVEASLASIEKAAENRAEVTLEYVLSSLKAVAERCMQADPVLDDDGAPTGEFRFDSSGANAALRSLLSYFEGKEKRKSGASTMTFQLFMGGPVDVDQALG